MTEYIIRYFNDRHIAYSYKLLARDVRHAIIQFQELVPGAHMKSVLPAEQWTN